MIKPLNDHHADSGEHDDDKPIGRVLSRREILALLGGMGAALLCGCTFTDLLTQSAAVAELPAEASTQVANSVVCVVKPELTEGPYFVDNMLNRADIRTEPSDGSIKDGVPLRLVIKVFDVSGGMCAPIEGAQVDVWHCDALGVCSGVADRSFDTSNEQWLRGYQITEGMGTTPFTTIYPGWYSGRAVHIHFKVRTDPAAGSGYEFTSQFFFDEAVTARVYQEMPYASKGQPDRPNTSDGIYQDSAGLLTLIPAQDVDGGYTATIEIGLDLS